MYEIIQSKSVSGGTKISVSAPMTWVQIPNISLQIYLNSAANGVALQWLLPAQTDTDGGSIVSCLRRGGVILGTQQPLWCSGKVMCSLSGFADDVPGYIGPLEYTLWIGAPSGTAHAPANFGGVASIFANEYVR